MTCLSLGTEIYYQRTYRKDNSLNSDAIKIFSPPQKLDAVLFDITNHTLANSVSMHQHTCIEMVFIVSGNARQILNGEEQNVYPGCVTILHPGSNHAFKNCRNCELYNVSCAPDLFAKMGLELAFLQGREKLFKSEKSAFSLNLSGLLFFDIRNILKTMYETYMEADSAEKHVKLRSLFNVLVVLLVQSWHPRELRESISLESVADYMEHHYSEKIVLKQLCRMAGCSSSVFFGKFRRKFHVSPMHYLLELRMRHACELLEKTDLPIYEIASSCGFYDSNHLIKLYKAKFGISPAKNRKQ